MFWNAQSITSISKQLQLELFLENERIDLLLLSETFLKQQHIFNIKNFTVYRNDRLALAHGGVAIAIRSSIHHKLCCPISTNIIENISVEISINNIQTTITSAYCPRTSPHFSNDLLLLTSLSTNYMIFGDFNAKHTSWNCRSNNVSGNALFSLQQNSDFMIYHTDSHTHFPHSGQSPSTIDLLISNVNFAFDLISNDDLMLSDHTPIICKYGTALRTERKTYDYSRANWQTFRRIINTEINAISNFESPAEIDIAINKFTELITTAKAASIPIRSNNYRSTISQSTQQLIQIKNAQRRRYQRMSPGFDKLRAKCELNVLHHRIKQAIINDHNHFMSKQLRGIKRGSKKLWNLAKKARGKCDDHTNKIKIIGQPSVSDIDKANCLAKIFEKSHSLTAAFTHENDINVTNTINAFNRFKHLSCAFPHIEKDEITSIIKSLKPFKSAGPDSIQNVLLKQLPSEGIDFITKIINKCIENAHWPSSFKTAKVIPILKAGKPAADPRSYRPISLLNSIGKLLEKVIHARLIESVEHKNLLPDFQFGFRKGHSTVHQAKRLQKFIARKKLSKKSTGVVLLDIEKAFDSIWHDGLIHKLIKMKLPTFLIRLIDAFVRDRNFAVHINNNTSNKINIPAGLAQGTCISPVLYALFVADMPSLNNTKLALYADDTAIYTAAKRSNIIVNRLNSSLIALHHYFIKWKIKVNATKTQAIIFTFNNRRIRIPSKPLLSQNSTIEWSKSINYLGIKFDKKQTFKCHIDNAIIKANKCFRALLPLLASKSHLSTINKTLIYTAVIRPILAYGAPVWSSAAQTHIKKINTLQNKILKTINNLPRRTPTYLLEQYTNIQSFDKFLRKSNINFIQNCSISNYQLIREIEL